MKILLCHNYYQQRGGEDQVFEDEAALLESRGHDVVRYTKHNDEVNHMSSLQAARRTVFNRKTYVELRQLMVASRPDVMHCTNTFPLISPSAYYAARAEGVPVVQSLHNFRLLCPAGPFLRNRRVCEDCMGKLFPWPGVVHRCYRGSRAASTVVAAMLFHHRLKKTWLRRVDCYIALSEFARRKFVAGGLPESQIVVKPNFVGVDPGLGDGRDGDALFIGRLSEEKGVAVLLDAWRSLDGKFSLRIIGDGPLAPEVKAAAASDASITWQGQRSHAEVLQALHTARCVIVPSICYENFPKAVVEGYATGTPLIAASIGSLPELVEHRHTGLLFTSGDGADLAAQVRQLMTDDELYRDMSRQARQRYLAQYTAEQNHQMLMDIYQRVRA